jgi:hypothetical protein
MYGMNVMHILFKSVKKNLYLGSAKPAKSVPSEGSAEDQSWGLELLSASNENKRVTSLKICFPVHPDRTLSDCGSLMMSRLMMSRLDRLQESQQPPARASNLLDPPGSFN